MMHKESHPALALWVGYRVIASHRQVWTSAALKLIVIPARGVTESGVCDRI
jgi:hypothetical protein